MAQRSATPELVVARLPGPHRVLLELDGPRGRFAIVADRPSERVVYRAGALALWRGGRWQSATGCPLDLVAERIAGLSPQPSRAELPFEGGAIGALGYGLRHAFEDLPSARHADPFPDLWLSIYPRALVHDRTTGRWDVVGAWAPGEVAPLLAPGELAPPRAMRVGPVASWMDGPQHARAVRRILEHIAAGDVYQINLTRRLWAPCEGDGFDAYRRLVAGNPAARSAYLEMEGDQRIASSSPELFLELEAGGRVTSRPIKGTRPRGATADEDDALARELAASPKDAAELAMIVDLIRNDLGRVARWGTVEVTSSGAIERHATVHHRVATVVAQLAAGRDWRDLIRATWPGGSITGAPKIRAMQLIAGLEPIERGIYTGSIGYVSASGAMSLSIAIRTAMLDGRRAWYGTGGGIVADSEAAGELAETEVKALPFRRMLGR